MTTLSAHKRLTLSPRFIMHPSRNCTKTLYGVPTEISLQYYGDSTLILVTQVGKVGNLVGDIAENHIQLMLNIHRSRYPCQQRSQLPLQLQILLSPMLLYCHHHQSLSSSPLYLALLLQTEYRRYTVFTHRRLRPLYGLLKQKIPFKSSERTLSSVSHYEDRTKPEN